MKITILSDIHTEFWQREADYYSPGKGEVLVLAGDIGNVNDLTPYSYFYRFLKEAGENYDRVFMVMGNHEFYGYDFEKAEETLRRCLPENITLLQNQTECYDGVHFIGATLWTDFKNGNSLEMTTAGSVMNDYHVITHGDRELTPSDILHEHDETINYLNEVIPSLRGKKVIITHHCPSFKSLSGDYLHRVTGAYATNLENFVEFHMPNLMIHGHCHEPADYKIGYTRVVSNPRGYAPDMIPVDYINKTITI